MKVLETSGEASEITPKLYVICIASRPFSSLPLFEPKQGLFFSLFLSQSPKLGIIKIKIKKLGVKNPKVEQLLWIWGMMGATLPWQHLVPSKPIGLCPAQNHKQFIPLHCQVSKIQAFRRSDFDVFARRITSGEAWRDAWRRANDGFEQLLYETKKTAERLDR